jgi:hypothetical protein
MECRKRKSGFHKEKQMSDNPAVNLPNPPPHYGRTRELGTGGAISGAERKLGVDLSEAREDGTIPWSRERTRPVQELPIEAEASYEDVAPAVAESPDDPPVPEVPFVTPKKKVSEWTSEERSAAAKAAWAARREKKVKLEVKRGVRRAPKSPEEEKVHPPQHLVPRNDVMSVELADGEELIKLPNWNTEDPEVCDSLIGQIYRKLEAAGQIVQQRMSQKKRDQGMHCIQCGVSVDARQAISIQDRRNPLTGMWEKIAWCSSRCFQAYNASGKGPRPRGPRERVAVR